MKKRSNSLTASEIGKLVSVLVLVVAFGVAGYGWVLNVIEIVHTGSDPITGLFIARVIGVFMAPLGCVLGYV